MGGPGQAWACRLHRDADKALMPTADTQDGGWRGRVDAWALTVGCAGGGSERSPHSLLSERHSRKGLSGGPGKGSGSAASPSCATLSLPLNRVPTL